mgnify:CR=1 FL=1
MPSDKQFVQFFSYIGLLIIAAFVILVLVFCGAFALFGGWGIIAVSAFMLFVIKKKKKMWRG